MFAQVFRALSEGFGKTLIIFALTLVGAIPLGLAICFGERSRVKPISYLFKAIIWVVRGTPLMIQLLVIYYVPGLLLHRNVWGQGETGRMVATVAAFVFNYACYFSEIYRGGMESVPVGQDEAGAVLGMTKWQTFWNVKLLQVIKHIVPPMSNEIITLVKDTSLARVIALQEVIWAGQSFMKTDGLVWPLFFTGVYYLLFSALLTYLLGKIEKRLSYFR